MRLSVKEINRERLHSNNLNGDNNEKKPKNPTISELFKNKKNSFIKARLRTKKSMEMLRNQQSKKNKEEGQKKKKSLYQRIEKLKKGVGQNNILEIKNQNLKEMQKQLMNRLEQQDEYHNQCMFEKQQEINGLSQKLHATLEENAMLKESLLQCQNELRKQRKFLKYYPMRVYNGKYSLQQKLEEQLKSQQKMDHRSSSRINSHQISNYGNTYLDLNLVVNNIPSKDHKKDHEENVRSPPPYTKLHRFVIDEEMVEEDSERMADNLRKKMRAEARQKLNDAGHGSNRQFRFESETASSKNQKNSIIQGFSSFPEPINIPSIGLKTPLLNKLAPLSLDQGKPRQIQLDSEEEIKPTKRGQNVTVCNTQGKRTDFYCSAESQSKNSKMSERSKESKKSKRERREGYETPESAKLHSNKTLSPKSPITPFPDMEDSRNFHHKRSKSNASEKCILGIKPELAELLNKFNEIPLDQLKRDIESFSEAKSEAQE